MYFKNSKNSKFENNSEQRLKFSIKKSNFGAISVVVGATILFGVGTGLVSQNLSHQLVSAESVKETKIDVTDFNADPTGQRDSTVAIQKAIEFAKGIDGKKTLVFPKGEYLIYPDKAIQKELYVSNTTGTDQSVKDKKLGIFLEDTKDMTIDGQGSMFMFHGKMTTLSTINSSNIKFKNMSIDFKVPTVVDMYADTVDGNSVTYRIPSEYNYKIDGNNIIWQSDKSPYTGQPYWQTKNGMNYCQVNDIVSGKTWRTANPIFNNVNSIEEVSDHVVKINYNGTPGALTGHSYQMRNTQRDTPGMFFLNSKNIALENVDVNFLHGFGLVFQTSDTLSLDNVHFKAPENSLRTTVGYADFLQVSGSKGKISVENSSFENPHDDPINVHGTFLKVVERISDRKVKVRYQHNETAGFPSFFKGDEVEFATAGNMTTVDNSVAKVVDVDGPSGFSHDKNLTDITLTFDRDLPQEIKAQSHVIENITYTPSVSIKNNVFKSVPTRGILVTTRKPVEIANNTFYQMGMASIYISNDAQGWYESGPVRDVNIHDNIFYGQQGAPMIFIEPTNPTVSNDKTVHRNIIIQNNHFYTPNGQVLNAKSVDNLQFKNNIVDRFDDQTKVTTSVKKNKIAVGSKVKLDTKVTGNKNSSELFHLNGDKNVLIKDNIFDGGLNLKGSFVNQTADEITQSGKQQVVFNGGDAYLPLVDRMGYEVSDSSIAKVLPSGELVGLKEGTVTVKGFITVGSKRYESKPVEIKVSGKNTETNTANLKITGLDARITAPTKLGLTGTTDTKITWSVKNLDDEAPHATIAADGTLTPVNAGVVEVKAELSDGTEVSKLVVVGQTKATLNPDFEIVRPDKSRLNLDTTKDALTITAGPGSLWAGGTANNVVVKSVKNADQLTVIGKVSGKTKQSYDEAGIILYKNDDNYVIANRKHANGNPALHLVNEQNQRPDESITKADIAATDIYYKLVKAGNKVTAYYSADGTNWDKFGEIQNSGLGSDFKVGFMAAGGADTKTPFTFSDLTIDGTKVSMGNTPSAPVVDNVVVTQTGNKVTANVTGADASTSQIKWMVADNDSESYSIIPGVTGTTLELDDSFKGMKVKAVVVPTGKQGNLADNLVYSNVITIKDDYTSEPITNKNSDTSLESVQVNGKDLNISNQKNFNLREDEAKNTMNLTFKASDSNAKLDIYHNGIKVKSGQGTVKLDDFKLLYGKNIFQVNVTAADGIHFTAYRFVQIRGTGLQSSDVDSEIKAFNENDKTIISGKTYPNANFIVRDKTGKEVAKGFSDKYGNINSEIGLQDANSELHITISKDTQTLFEGKLKVVGLADNTKVVVKDAKTKSGTKIDLTKSVEVDSTSVKKEVLTQDIDFNKVGESIVKVRLTFKDGSQKDVDVKLIIEKADSNNSGGGNNSGNNGNNSGNNGNNSGSTEENQDNKNQDRIVSYKVNGVGYKVRLWQITNGKPVLTDKYLADGTKVKISETKDFNGISYTKLADGLWIQTKYLVTEGEASKPTTPINKVVKYQGKGSVLLWNLSGNKPTSAKRYLKDGAAVKVYEVKTVNGVSYSRIGTDEWIQTQYLANSNVATEKPLKGIVKVNYNGRGKVALWTKDHKLSGQYVAKNTSWKVFASKKMNGKTYYRIGTQNQWIEATYAKFK